MMKETFGALLRRRRKELGLTQWDVMERTGISQTYISKLEHNRVDHPGPDVLQRLSAALEIDILDLQTAMGWIAVVSREGVMLPVRGRVPADSVRYASGQDGASMQEIEVLPGKIADTRSPYALEVTGDCFHSIGILSGDVVIVDAAEGRSPRNYQLVVVRIGREVTLKRWVETEEGIELRDGDESVVHRITAGQGDDLEVLAFYVTFEPLAPR